MIIDVGKEIKRGLFWFGSASILSRLISLVGTLLVLRVLPREAVGLAALVTSVAAVVEAFSGLGVATAAVQSQTLSSDEQDSLFWLCMMVAAVLMVVTALGSPLVASFYGNAALQPMVLLTTVKLLFVGLSLMPIQRLSRELRFKELGGVQTFAVSTEAITKVVLAYLGLGAWAIVIGFNARTIYLVLILLLIGPFWPRWHFKFSEVGRFVSFGLRFLTANTITQTHRSVDQWLVGRMLGLSPLGLYRVALDLAMGPVEAVAQLAKRVAFPVLSRVTSDRQATAQAFLRVTSIVMMFNAPAVVVTFFFADQLILLMLGERWLPAAPIVRVLCWSGLVRGINQVFPQLFDAVGKPQLSIVDSVTTLITLALSILGALRFFGDTVGLAAVGGAWIVSTSCVLALLLLLAKTLVPIGLADVVRVQAPIVGAVACMMVAIWALQQLLGGPWLPAPAVALLAGCAGLVVYYLFLRATLRVRLRDLRP